MTVRVEQGDCLEVMPRLAAEGVMVDAIVCDPPYHLTSIVKRFGKAGSAEAQHGTDGLYARASRGFMGKEWDGGDVAFRAETWTAALALLKPGGHLIAFSGTRTYHRMACAIEDAGFEIRDQIGWLYGSGFPKSHDVAKGIAKRRTEDVAPVRAVCRFVRRAMDERALKSSDLTAHFGDCNARLIDHWAARDSDSQPSLPTPDQWLTLKDVLSLGDEMDSEVARLNARKGHRGERWTGAEIIGETTIASPGFGDLRFDGDRSIRVLDEDAARWEGWGTALKPAWEPIVLARKPLAGSVASNVLAHGTGALNIGDCRIGDEVRHAAFTSLAPCSGNRLGEADTAAARRGTQGDPKEYVGRWPANVIHDGSDEVVSAFPQTASGSPAAGEYGGMGFHGAGAWPMPPVAGDSGSAARFFYSSKADADDRLGSKHPTVKPTDLMAYLCRLVTPPGGTVLDPFAGSGSTGMACLREGFNAILIEREDEYVADIRRRLAHVEGADTPLFGGLAA